MNTINAIAASVTGARHLRTARNGQDAGAAWIGDEAAAVVVCDGCSAGASSEVGARLGASLVVRAIAAGLCSGRRPSELWDEVRREVVGALARLLEHLDDRALHDHLLFTIVAAAATRSEAAVWALGDGAYAVGAEVRVLGPFEANQPPYLAYDLIGEPRPARLETTGCDSIVVATDGALELELDRFAAPRFVEHPDALRRELAILARADERIDWERRRIERMPAALQDDCAIGVVRREAR